MDHDDRSTPGHDADAWSTGSGPGDDAGSRDVGASGGRPPRIGRRGGGPAGAVSAGAGAGAVSWARAKRRSGSITAVLAPLEAALIAVSDPGGLCDEDLSEAVVDLQRLRSRLDAIAASHVARWDARCLWASDNSRAAGARLARDVGASPAGANATVATARRVRTLAVVAHAWATGQISTDHVTRLTRAATPERAQAFTRSEAELVAAAQDLDWAGFERAVRFFETAADDERLDPTNPDDVAAHERRERAKRRCKVRPVGDGWHLDAHLDRVGGAEVHATWERIYQELFEADYARARELQGEHVGADRMDRTPDQRRADALVEMARRAGATRPGDQMPRPSVSVVVSAGELFGPIRDLFNGLVLSRLEVARLLTEADIESILFDDTTAQPVTVTSRARFFTGALRRAVEVPDRVCCHPTCHVEAEHCQIDHIIEVAAGGQTTVTNGRLLCPTHNRQRPGRQPHTGATKDRGNGGQRSSDQSSREQGGDPDGDPHQPRVPSYLSKLAPMAPPTASERASPSAPASATRPRR